MINDSSLKIYLPADMLPAELPSWLLATLAQAPRKADDPHWTATATALRVYGYRLRAEHDGDWGKAPQLVRPSDLLLPENRQVSLVRKALQRINAALAAAHAAMPLVLNQKARLDGVSTDLMAKNYREPLGISAQIERVISQHDARSGAIEEVAGDDRLIVGMPRFTGGQSDRTNFIAGVLKPAEPVLHYAIALAWVINVAENALAQQHPDRSDWPRIGLHAEEFVDHDGQSAFRPMLQMVAVLTSPELSERAMELGGDLLPATRAILNSPRRAHDPPILLGRCHV